MITDFVLPIGIAMLVFLISILIPMVYSGQHVKTFEYRWNRVVKPTIGGFFFFLSILVWLLWVFSTLDSKQDVFRIAWLGVASLMAFLVGWLDDRFGTAPLPKLIGQVLVAFFLIAGNWIMPLFDNKFVDSLITIVWIVALQNAFNFFDNMNGVTGIISLIIFLFMVFTPIDLTYKFMYILVSFALLGFLFHNFPPSRIYMGDKGSLLIGTIASISPILLCQSGCDNLGWIEKLLLFTVFIGLPAIDIVLVIIHRICRRTPPWVGGTDHLSHSFYSLLGSERKVVIGFATLQTILVVSSGIVLRVGNTILITLTLIMWMALFLIMFIIHWRYVPEPYNSLCYKHTAEKMPSWLRRLLMRCDGHPASL